jgi:hypothetical protein
LFTPTWIQPVIPELAVLFYADRRVRLNLPSPRDRSSQTGESSAIRKLGFLLWRNFLWRSFRVARDSGTIRRAFSTPKIPSGGVVLNVVATGDEWRNSNVKHWNCGASSA